MKDQELWTVRTLQTALQDSAMASSGSVRIELLEGSEPSLLLQMLDYGDLPVFLAVVGEQIVVEAMLWPVAQVKDVTAFNDQVLRTHKLFPLSTIGIETLPEVGDAYIMFGALSAASSLSDVQLELETLADNVIRATEAFETQLITV